MVSGGGGGDVSVVCKGRRILEVVSNVLRLYVGVESEGAQVVQCTLLEKCCQAGGATACLLLAARARVSAGSLRGTGRAVRRAAASDGAGEGVGEGAGAA